MEIRELAVRHAFEFSPIVRGDDRGAFLESFRADLFADATGRTFDLRQTNISVSRRGVARGIHFAEVRGEHNQNPAATGGQAKYVTAVSGSVVDFVIDIRVDSPTFGQWDAVELDDVARKTVFVPEGVGHLFVATSDSATVNYLTNDSYRPVVEHSISPLDPSLGLELPFGPDEIVLSPQDRAAPTLDQAFDLGLLPHWADSVAVYASLAPDVSGTGRPR